MGEGPPLDQQGSTGLLVGLDVPQRVPATFEPHYAAEMLSPPAQRQPPRQDHKQGEQPACNQIGSRALSHSRHPGQNAPERNSCCKPTGMRNQIRARARAEQQKQHQSGGNSAERPL